LIQESYDVKREDLLKSRKTLRLCFATTRWSVVTLDPGKRQMNILLLVDTTIEGASPSHARQE
jgi:hypothetical protein